MLQVITGRFFDDKPVNERLVRAPIYSNLQWPVPLETSVVSMFPSGPTTGRISTYVMEYTARYQPHGPDDIMIMVGWDQPAEQFPLLCTLWFRAIFHTSESHVRSLCQDGSARRRESGSPSSYFERYFDAPATTDSKEVLEFSRFLDNVLSLPRKDYRLLIQCATAFVDGLEAVATNRDLSYSMFVYLLEALSATHKATPVGWEDYPIDQRRSVDKALSKASPETSHAVRTALLKAPHLKLKKRFVEFVSSLVDESFFTNEAVSRNHVLRRSQLEEVLSSLYKSRSGFVHSLDPILESIRLPMMPTNTDVVEWDNRLHLTFSGLIRLVRHVLLKFVERAPHTATEDYPGWRRELPGIVSARLAPECWIGNVNGFAARTANQWLEGFLSQLLAGASSGRPTITGLQPHMERIEQTVQGTESQPDRAMLALYHLYQVVMMEQNRRPQWQQFLQSHFNFYTECSVELLLVDTFLHGYTNHSPTSCEAAYRAYDRGRYSKASLNCPTLCDIAMLCVVANAYLRRGAIWDFRRILKEALLECGGRQELQQKLRQSLQTGVECNAFDILALPRSPDSLPPVHFRRPIVTFSRRPSSAVSSTGTWEAARGIGLHGVCAGWPR